MRGPLQPLWPLALPGPALPPDPGPAGFLHEQPAGHICPHALSLPARTSASRRSCLSQPEMHPKKPAGAPPSLQLRVQGVSGMAYHITNRQQLLRRRVGTRNRSSTEWWALAEPTSSSMLDVSTWRTTGSQ